jgi:hypothetical protein
MNVYRVSERTYQSIINLVAMAYVKDVVPLVFKQQ